jgi:hypothetical protein
LSRKRTDYKISVNQIFLFWREIGQDKPIMMFSFKIKKLKWTLST